MILYMLMQSQPKILSLFLFIYLGYINSIVQIKEPKLHCFIIIISIYHHHHHHHRHPIFIPVYPHKRGWPDLPHFGSNLTNSHCPSRSIHRHPPPNQHSCSPSALASSLVILASSCPSLQTPKLFSKHAYHPSSTHAHTISCTPFTFAI